MKGDDKEAVSTLRLPSHHHPLVPDYFGFTSYVPRCVLCRCALDDDGYSCTTCDFCAHKRCAEAPPLIPRHPFHSIHPLYLSSGRPSFTCNACDQTLDFCSSLGCDECGFFLDLRCALYTLPDVECSEEEQIQVPVHDHPLTSFLATQEFRWDCYCALCRDIISEEGAYICLHPRCKFLIHKRCIQDLYYEDGSRVPRVYQA